VALADNDNFDWAPQRPVKMYYCTADEQVNFQNSLDAEAAMTAAGAVDVEAVNSGPLTHGFCIVPALSGALNWFNSVKTNCITTGIEELNINIGLSPNPVTNIVNISLDKAFDFIRINAMDGKVVLEEKLAHIHGNANLNLEDLSSGNYLISVYNGNNLLGSKTLVKK